MMSDVKESYEIYTQNVVEEALISCIKTFETTCYGGSATLPRRILCSGNVQSRAAAASGRRPESAPQPLRASGNVPLFDRVV